MLEFKMQSNSQPNDDDVVDTEEPSFFGDGVCYPAYDSVTG